MCDELETIDEVIAANYKPDYDAEILGLITLKTYNIKLEDLAKATITCQKPMTSDGSVSLSIKGDELIVTFNTDFIANYEKKLFEKS